MPNWTTPDFAFRFARKEDAENAAPFLCPNVAIVATERLSFSRETKKSDRPVPAH